MHDVKEEIKELWCIAWPVILTNMLNVLVGMVDLKMIGKVSVDAIAAVGMARQTMMLIMVLMIAISGGCSTLVARAHGASDHETLSRTVSRSLFFMFVLAVGVITPAGLIFSRSILLGLGGEPAVVDLGVSYLHILFAGSVFTLFNFTISAILLGVGRTKVSLFLLIIVNSLNILLNWLFIFGIGFIPEMGVEGAALGTVLSRGIGSIAGIWILVTPELPIRADFRDALSLDFSLLRKLLYLGGPRSLQGIVRNFSRVMIIRIITLLPESTHAVSAYSVGMQVRMVSTFVGLAFMGASMSRVGQNLGCGNPDLAEKTGWIAAGMATVLMSIVALAFMLAPEMIASFFTEDASVITMGQEFFVIIALTEPFMASAFAFGGALRGGGDAISPFIYASLSDLLIVLGVGYFLAIVLKMGFKGLIISIAISAFTRAIPSMLKFKAGKWKAIRI